MFWVPLLMYICSVVLIYGITDYIMVDKEVIYRPQLKYESLLKSTHTPFYDQHVFFAHMHIQI